MKYTGYIKEPVRTRDQYVLGVNSPVPKIVLQSDGQWDDFLPQDESQKVMIDSCNCTSFGTLNAVEILMRRMGIEFNGSDRFLGISAGTYPPGNTIQKVLEALRNKGVVDESILPFTDSIQTIDEYFSPNPLSETLKQIGLLWTDKYDFKHEWVDSSTEAIKEALTLSPLGVAVYAWYEEGGVYKRLGDDTHWTCVYGYYENGDWKCYDSYAPFTKRLSVDFTFDSIKRFHIDQKLLPKPKSCWFNLFK